MPENSEDLSIVQKVSLCLAALGFLLAIITASSLRETAEKCVLRPK